MADPGKARIAENEALYRAINERLAAWEERGTAPADERHIFFCECGRETCDERIVVTMAEYEQLRADPTRFGVLPGHETLEAERVVERRDGYIVVEKHADVRDVAERTDPRS
ncbi:MAG TPA: hypothetical protein VN213_01350 [Solirubrobacteraceae bacterium]|nr:hypothetical protein [Solirubrobacteraceae bacterium]